MRWMSFAGCAAGSARPVTVYVANAGENTVTPIRAASDTAARPIKVGRGPALMAISPDGRAACVVGIGGVLPGAAPVTLTVIDTATSRPGRIMTVCAHENLGDAVAIAISPDSRTAYVSCPGAGKVVRLPVGTDASPKTIRISSPGALAMTADGRTVYVANVLGDTITPISTATDEAQQPIIVGQSPHAMAITPDGQTVLVLTETGLTPVDAATNRPGNPVAIEGAHALAVAPDGGTAYVLAMPSPDSQQGFVIPVDVRAGAPGAPIEVGLSPQQIAFTPDGNMAYVTNYASGSVTPIRLADGRAEPEIAAGRVPTRLAVSPDGKTVYVLDSNILGGLGPGMLIRAMLRRSPFGRGQVIPIRVATHSAGKPIKVGRLPLAVVIASLTTGRRPRLHGVEAGHSCNTVSGVEGLADRHDTPIKHAQPDGPVTSSPPATFKNCTDNFFGTDTITTSGSWSLSNTDAGDPASEPNSGDELTINIPNGGASFTSTAFSGRTITVNALTPTSSSFNDSNAATYSNAGLNVVGNSSCTPKSPALLSCSFKSSISVTDTA